MSAEPLKRTGYQWLSIYWTCQACCKGQTFVTENMNGTPSKCFYCKHPYPSSTRSEASDE